MINSVSNLVIRVKDLGRHKWIIGIGAVLCTTIMQFAVITYLLNANLPLQFLEQFFKSSGKYTVIYGALLIVGFWIRGWIGKALTLTITLTIFLLPLIAIWEHVTVTSGAAIGGLLPWSDANSYYIDASALLDGYPIGFSARRPLFVGLLATLLKFTNGNLTICILVLVILNAIATFFLAQEISLNYGPLSGAIITILSLLFYKHAGSGGVGTTLTENLGLALGATSVAIMFAAIRRSSKPMMLASIYFLTLALCARAGTFFILPCVIIASAVIFKGIHKLNLKLMAFGIGISICGFITSFLLGTQISKYIGQAPFSNFSYTLYGLVVGGKGWTQVMADYPLAREGTDIYKLAFAHFKSHPFDLVQGMIKMWAEYLPGHHYHAYQFFDLDTITTIAPYIHPFIYVLLILGITWCCLNIKNGHALLLLSAFIGHFASIPFVPPIDAGLRAYAATVVILFILPAIGMMWLLTPFETLLRKHLANHFCLYRTTTKLQPSAQIVTHLQVVFAIILSASAVAGPIIIKSTATLPRINTIDCLPSQDDIYFHYNPGSNIHIVSNHPDGASSRLPFIDLDIVQSEVSKLQLTSDPGTFSNYHTLTTTYNIVNKSVIWVTLPSMLAPHRKSIISACGRWSNEETARRYGVFYVESATAYQLSQ